MRRFAGFRSQQPATSSTTQQQTLVGHDHEGMGGLPDLAQRIEARVRKQTPFSQPRRPYLSKFLENCQQIQLPKISDSRGSLSVIEGENHIPFKIHSANWISDGAELANGRSKPSRGREEFVLPLSGSIEVTYDNGWGKQHFHLDQPDHGLYIPDSSRRQVRRLTADTVVLVLAS